MGADLDDSPVGDDDSGLPLVLDAGVLRQSDSTDSGELPVADDAGARRATSAPAGSGGCSIGAARGEAPPGSTGLGGILVVLGVARLLERTSRRRGG